MNFIKLYLAYVKMHFKARIEYKSNFYAGIFANFYSYFITFASIWILIGKFGTIDNWNYQELCLLYGMNLLTYAVAGTFFWTVMGLEKDITSGNLDVLLIRPSGCIQQIVCRKFVDTFIGQMIIAISFMFFSFVNLKFRWTLYKIVLFAVFLAGSILLHSGAMIFFGALSFWLKRSLPLADILYYDMRNFIQYPLSIFPKIIQVLLTFILPWAFINYYPISLLIGKEQNYFHTILGFLSPLIGIVLFCLSIKLFYIGLKRYNSSGS